MKYNSIGEQLVAKAKELDPSYKPDKFNDMSEALDVILNNSGSNNFIELEFNIRDIIDEESGLLNLDTFDFTLPANTISEETFEELVLNKKEGFKLKFYFTEEEYGKIYYANIIAYPIAMQFISTNIVNMLGTQGYWSGSIEDPTVDNIFHFNKISSTDKIWYNVEVTDFTITQTQYDEIKTLVENNQLAGIKMDLIYAYLLNSHNGTFVFYFPLFDDGACLYTFITIKSDLTITTDGGSLLSMPTTAPTSQVIPSITTSNKQQNLTIGNGLAIVNGVLKTTGGGGQSIEDLPVVELTPESEITTITDETVKAKILENVNNDNYLICKLKMPHLSTIEILITRDAKLVPNDIIKNTVFTQTVFINLGLVSSTLVFTLSINSEDGTIAIEYEMLGYIKSNQVSLFQKVDGAFGVTTDYGDTNNINGLTFYFDTINGKPIIHRDTTVNNYNIPTIPTLPSDASTKTYALKAVNGVLTWVE